MRGDVRAGLGGPRGTQDRGQLVTVTVTPGDNPPPPTFLLTHPPTSLPLSCLIAVSRGGVPELFWELKSVDSFPSRPPLSDAPPPARPAPHGSNVFTISGGLESSPVVCVCVYVGAVGGGGLGGG